MNRLCTFLNLLFEQHFALAHHHEIIMMHTVTIFIPSYLAVVNDILVAAILEAILIAWRKLVRGHLIVDLFASCQDYIRIIFCCARFAP